MSPLRFFISHSHQDKALASALQTLITGTFGDTAVVDYSSDDAPGGGIRAGGTWLEWIMAAVRHTHVCIVILTEESAIAPWVTWETGAVTGVAMASEALTPAPPLSPIRVVPLLFGIDVDRVPAPLHHQQAVRGDQETGVRKLLFMLRERGGVDMGPSALPVSEQSVSTFVDTVHAVMQRRAHERPARLQTVDLSAVHFVNARQGLTLEPRNGGIADGVRLRCGAFTGDPHQRWLLYPVGVDTYRVTTVDGAKCISIEDDSKRPGKPAILWDYVGHESQHWRLTKPFGTGGMPVSLINAFSGCLLASAADSKDVTQSRRANVTNEDWWMLLAGRM